MEITFLKGLIHEASDLEIQNGINPIVVEQQPPQIILTHQSYIETKYILILVWKTMILHIKLD